MTSSNQFPNVRMRRLRYHPGVRQLVRSTRLAPTRTIMPLFVRHGTGIKQPIGSMPGHFQWSVDRLSEPLEQVAAAGVGGVILFGIPAAKDSVGSDACRDEGIIPQAIRRGKQLFPNSLILSDVCFCEYTDHGHCGIIANRGEIADVDNDATLEILGQQAVTHARAGVDMVAPSGMMDGMVRAMRSALDAAGHAELPIMSYAAKYASAYYGPFREAAESAPQFGDRRTYQMDPASAAGQAIREVELDVNEGADIVMVKPALAYLDIIHRVRERFPEIPIAAYNVSGEFSMVKAAAANGWVDEKQVALETLIAIHRAGADIIITYWACDLAAWLAESS